MGSRILKDPSTANCRIFVGHLQTDDMNKNELESHFSKYGVIIGSSMNRGFGFVQFENEMSAQMAIQKENGQMLKGRRIDVKPAKKDSGGGGGRGMNDNSKPDSTNNPFSPRNNPFRNNSFSSGGNQNQSSDFSKNQQNSPQKNQSNFGGNSTNNSSSSSNNTNQQQQQQSFSSTTSSSSNQKQDDSSQFEEKPKDPCPPSSTEEFNDNNQNQDDNDVQMIESFNGNQSRDSNDSFNSQNQSNRAGNNQTNRQDEAQSGNQSSGSTTGNNDNDSSPNNGQNRQNNQNRSNSNTNSNNNQNRNQNNSNNNSNNNQGNNSGRTRGSRGGKNRGKNRDNLGGGGGGGGGGSNSSNNSSNFRDRSPLNRGGNRPGNDDKRDWDHNRMQRGNNDFGPRSQQFNNDMRFDDRFNDSMPGFGRGSSLDYPSMPPQPDKNDCEIIVVSKLLTEYAEAIELRLKKIGLTVDLLFPNEEVPLSRVLGNIASRGCLYAVVITPINLERHSMTLNILHGVPQEHRNMTVDDALNLIARDFGNFKSGDRSMPLNVPFAADRHPDAIQVLLNILVNNHQLTVLQYDRLLKYLEIKREEQVQIELGDVKDVPSTAIAVADPKHAELQSRILNILNSSKGNSNSEANTLSVSVAGNNSNVTPKATPATPVSTPALLASSTPAPASAPPANNWTTGSTAGTTSTTASTGGVTPSPLLNDPTVQKALDSLLQGNLLKNIGGESTPVVNQPQPLFAAFPNINRF